MTVQCKGCKKDVMWKKPYVQGDKPVELDGKEHICPEFSKKKSFTVSKFPVGKMPEIFDLSMALLDTLQEKHKLNLSSTDKAIFVESVFRTISGSYKP